MNWSGQPMRTTGVVNPKLVQLFQHRAAESALQHVIFQREHHIDAARVELQHLHVDRLGESAR